MATEEQKDTEEREGGEPESQPGQADGAIDEEKASAGSDDEEASAGSDDDGSSDEDDEGSSDGDDEGSSDGDDEEGASASASDAGDDEHDDADEAPSSTAAAAAPRARSSGPGSAGARLAAAKAAKAAKKAAKKSKAAAGSGVPGASGGDPTKEQVDALKESSIGIAATKAADWAQTNRNLAIGIFAVIVLGAIGWVGYAWWRSSEAEAAGALLADAIEIANAEIRSADASDPDETASDDEASDEEDDAPTFATRDERAEAALAAYRRVLSEHASSEAARWARLGEARALFDLDQMDDARASYEQALRVAGGDPVVAWRALEGIGFTYESSESWDEAISKYEELRSIEDGAYQAPADYHIARMRIAKGETVQATTMLRELVTTLRATGESEEPEFPYVLAQAEVRLRELDPGAAAETGSPMMIGPQGGADGLPPGLEGIDPQILEQLRRQLQQGAGEGGGGEGAGGAGEGE